MTMESLPGSIQELTSIQAKFCLAVERFGNLKSGVDFASHSLLVGTSGGIDSTALLIISTLLAQKSGGRVFCAHVDHGLRDSSAGDSAFVEELCAKLDVPLKSITADVKIYAEDHSLGLEEAGRVIRYGFFRKCLNELSADFLLTAHHLDDLSEDVIMRLIRGAGWPALSGMDAYDPERNLLRPLLFTRKAQLETFLNSINCPWREDESNLSDKYTRNRIRNKIMPLLLKENPNFGAGIARLKSQAELDEEFWTTEVNKVLNNVQTTENGEILLHCSILHKCHPALRLRIYKRMIEMLGAGHVLADTITLLDRAFVDQKGGTTFQFPGNKVAAIRREGIVFKVIKTIDRESGRV
ncbi:tRNA lysidine(34) synthetase TilS [Maridesulfovibrio hydrothermalis]|uniref:tRNA(Ile)-lysidine synthase n=1 Tax=Maridesulfovibrio hydrothermalis AM13 = DSM 14728 TaxID=1121451 RepID=L0RG64_9BACT|nr:tRNA lysidine(34) synthetase TilS [Maridesulfovibrio hydrothermalis]CCO24551.1 tRNA(Ile)-lysidine synthase [Maridesulfovibrio hydrothermalis AM13 = DSM 14728]